jgi:PAS domain-containing protein
VEEADRNHDALDLALRALLDQHGDALVGAIDEDGLFVPMPASVPLRGQPVLAGRSALDVVTPPDRVVVITTWERARRTGAARTPVRLAAADGAPATLHFIDGTAGHGVYVAVLVAEQDVADLERVRAMPAATPRIARTHKNELAVLVAIDEATTRMLGWKPEEMVGRRSLDFIHPDDQERAIENWMEMLSRPGQSACATPATTARGSGSRSAMPTCSTTRSTATSWPRWSTSPTRWRRRRRCGPASSC